MVYEFKFARYGNIKKLALYVPRSKFYGPPKSEEPKVLKVQGSSFGIVIFSLYPSQHYHHLSHHHLQHKRFVPPLDVKLLTG